MTGLLAGAVSVAMALAARSAVREQPPVARVYPSVDQAVAAALIDQPVAIGFGEFHQTLATAHIPSALQRFTRQILPGLSAAAPPAGAGPTPPRLSHLVVETWISTGRCGDTERAVTEDVQKTTQRPPETAGELETLLRTAAARGVAPRVLSVSCADYQAMRGRGAGVDYDRTLRITARALEEAGLSALAQRRKLLAASPGAPAPGAGGRGSAAPTVEARSWAVALYGGALHNDVHPDPSLAAYSFAPRLLAATLGRYVEIDLIVPEYAARSDSLRAQPWWRAYLRSRRGAASVGAAAVVMVRRSARSFVIVFPSTSLPRR